MRGGIALLGAALSAVALAACGSGGMTESEGRSQARSERTMTTATTATVAVSTTDRAAFGGRTKTATRGEELRLSSLSARIEEITATEALTAATGDTTRADGVFIVARLTVRNLSNAPRTVVAGGDAQIGLLIGEQQFGDDFDSQWSYAEDSFLAQDRVLQPGAAQTGTIVFDVPPAAARRVDREGRLIAVNFGDAVEPGYLEEASEVGFIRLWE